MKVGAVGVKAHGLPKQGAALLATGLEGGGERMINEARQGLEGN